MELLINDQKYSVEAEADESLLQVLREHLDLTGTKYGCGEGSCGACTVLINGTAVRSCNIPAASARGKSITTIEGLGKNELHSVQQAFLEEDAFQCSYCAPGMVMSTVSLLKKNSAPTDGEIISAMQGNICRCGTYPKIISAIHKAIELQKS
jgi:aerobic-type carbon monoxide dehydrogenase small subunit (CoxS/CutS family)